MNKNKRQMKKFGRFILPCIGNGVICGTTIYFVESIIEDGHTFLGVFLVCGFLVACVVQVLKKI